MSKASTMVVKEAATLEELRTIIHEKQEGEDVLVVNTAHCSAEEFTTRVKQAKGLVADFDGTLHAGSQWKYVRGILPPELAEEDLQAAMRYFDKNEETHSDFEDIQFILGSVQRMVAGCITHKHLSNGAGSMTPRHGACELIDSFGNASTIVSFGMWDFIRSWGHQWLHRDVSVSALRLRFSGGNPDFVSGCDPLTVVSDGNKGYIYFTFRAVHGLADEEVLVLGDAPTDIKMMRPGGLGVLILPHADPQIGRQGSRWEALPRLWPRVAACLLSDSLEGLAHMRR